MYILNQSKTKIYCVTLDELSIPTPQIITTNFICIKHGNSQISIGEYKTLARAKEVLQEIFAKADERYSMPLN